MSPLEMASRSGLNQVERFEALTAGEDLDGLDLEPVRMARALDLEGTLKRLVFQTPGTSHPHLRTAISKYHRYDPEFKRLSSVTAQTLYNQLHWQQSCPLAIQTTATLLLSHKALVPATKRPSGLSRLRPAEQ